MSAVKRINTSVHSNLVSGLLLIGVTVIALAWANSPLADSYEASRSFTFGSASLDLNLPLEAWAAGGLLAVFFFIVGNELPRRRCRPVAVRLPAKRPRSRGSAGLAAVRDRWRWLERLRSTRHRSSWGAAATAVSHRIGMASSSMVQKRD